MIANKLAFAVLTLIVLLAIAFFAVYRKTGTVTVGAIDLYLCLHNLKYIILPRLSLSFITSAYFLIHHQKKIAHISKRYMSNLNVKNSRHTNTTNIANGSECSWTKAIALLVFQILSHELIKCFWLFNI